MSKQEKMELLRRNIADWEREIKFCKDELAQMEKTYRPGDKFTIRDGTAIIVLANEADNTIVLYDPDRQKLWNDGKTYKVQSIQEITPKEISCLGLWKDEQGRYVNEVD